MARPKPTPEDEAHGRMAERILSTSGTMVGVCATMIGLVKLTEVRRGLSHIDELAGVTAVLFVFCALLAYLALRSRRPLWRARLEATADLMFLIGLAALAVLGVLFAFDVI
jgi:magnesium-transporting ATPase (P-type)